MCVTVARRLDSFQGSPGNSCLQGRGLMSSWGDTDWGPLWELLFLSGEMKRMIRRHANASGGLWNKEAPPHHDTPATLVLGSPLGVAASSPEELEDV